MAKYDWLSIHYTVVQVNIATECKDSNKLAQVYLLPRWSTDRNGACKLANVLRYTRVVRPNWKRFTNRWGAYYKLAKLAYQLVKGH